MLWTILTTGMGGNLLLLLFLLGINPLLGFKTTHLILRGHTLKPFSNQKLIPRLALLAQLMLNKDFDQPTMINILWR